MAVYKLNSVLEVSYPTSAMELRVFLIDEESINFLPAIQFINGLDSHNIKDDKRKSINISDRSNPFTCPLTHYISISTYIFT